MNNVATHPAHQNTGSMLSEKLVDYLRATGDPRAIGGAMKWEGADYFAEKDKRPVPGSVLRKELDLQEEYSYVD